MNKKAKVAFLLGVGLIVSLGLFTYCLERFFNVGLSQNNLMSGLWDVLRNVLYSVIASFVFYYIMVYLPQERKKVKLLSAIHRKTVLIDDLVRDLFHKLRIRSHNRDYKEFNSELNEILIAINPDDTISIDDWEYENWHQYLYVLKEKLIDIIRSITVYHEFLEVGYLAELSILEIRLLDQITFDGYKKLAITNFTYAEITFSEIFIHNDILQKIKSAEALKYKDAIEAEGKTYRALYY
jgi:hypothetical protein